MCVDVVESPHALRHVLHAGLRMPIDAGYTAQVFLAFAEVLEQPEDTPAYTAKTVTDRTELAATLAKVRRHGYAVTSEQTFHGVAGFSAPIRDPEGRLLAAVSVTGPKQPATAGRAARVGPAPHRCRTPHLAAIPVRAGSSTATCEHLLTRASTLQPNR